jgi:dihydrodipicolinate synthase/N-acetylneuraminate lyase
MLKRDEIRGTWGTLLLPIAADDSIVWTLLKEELDALIAAGVDGIYSNGTACEFYSQSEAEFDRIQETVAARCERAGVPFQTGASHTSAQTMLERVQRAKQLHPSAIQVILPDWYPLNPQETLCFLERIISAAAPVGIVVYNPPHAKRVLAPAEWIELAARLTGLVGVKLGGDDDAWYAAMRATGLSVFVPGHQLATGFARGAAGAYSNVACLNPAGAKRWNEQMKTDLTEALQLEKRIQTFMDDCVMPFRRKLGVSNAALDKLLAFIGGWANVGLRLRWPYRWIEEADAIGLRKIARERLPELFEEERKS